MGENTLTDEEVTTACSLHIDNMRRLITWGAVRPVQAGGGRGRVRLWSFSQAMRIAVTAEFFEAGFSLQMAHTLTYCLPFDGMLTRYNPKFLRDKVDLDSPENFHLKEMLSQTGTDYWPYSDHIGHVIVLDRRLVYGDILGGTYDLFGIIDSERNRLHPTWDPRKFHVGLLTALELRKHRPDFKSVAPSSLLIDKNYFKASRRQFESHRAKIGKNVETHIDDPSAYLFRNCLHIDFGVGLAVAFRKLLGLPASYPYEMEFSHA